jgi:hypothetical protein
MIPTGSPLIEPPGWNVRSLIACRGSADPQLGSLSPAGFVWWYARPSQTLQIAGRAKARRSRMARVALALSDARPLSGVYEAVRLHGVRSMRNAALQAELVEIPRRTKCPELRWCKMTVVMGSSAGASSDCQMRALSAVLRHRLKDPRGRSVSRCGVVVQATTRKPLSPQ